MKAMVPQHKSPEQKNTRIVTSKSPPTLTDIKTASPWDPKPEDRPLRGRGR